ncbi:MAG: FHA domain-containing protein [Planctomycetes bacterium]|nr:FHA domain-containing protein [Planctomycetota bacterium]
MADTRLIIGHGRHRSAGPHGVAPADFVPLRLCLDGQRWQIEIVCPVAVIGRHTEADLRFAYPDVSRRHCRLVFEEGVWRVEDLQSLNGIYVNNALTSKAALYAGDMLRVGAVSLLILAATPVRLSKSDEEKHAKLRQIADVFPAEG